MGIMRTKSVEQSIRDTEEPEFQLRKALGPLDLTVFGIGVIIGTGLFVLTGEAAAVYAGEGSACSHDWMAVVVIALVSTILVIGIKLSSMFNQVITGIKILVTLFIIGFGIWFIKLDNLTPFIPAPKPGGEAYGSALDGYLLPTLLGIDTIYGVTGIFTGAALVFFAFIGFDIVATMSEETRNPQRDMPIGILASLAICTLLYFLASIVFTGLVPYTELGTSAPAATALAATPFPAAQFVVSAAILVGLTVVVMILILGQSRVAFAMSRDNLLPLWFSRVHTRFRTPYRITILTGLVAGLLAFWLPLTALAELVNIGTLAAFILVSIGIIVLRRSRPDLPRAFKVPGHRVLPAYGLPDLRHLGPVLRLDGNRDRVLLCLQQEP